MTTAAMLAICLLTFAEATSMAEAASLPQNGKIVFDSNRNTPENTNIERDIRLTNNPASDRAFDWQPQISKSRSVTVHPPKQKAHPS